MLFDAVLFARTSFLRFFRRWTAPASRALYLLVVFWWPVISVLHRPPARSRPAGLCTALGLGCAPRTLSGRAVLGVTFWFRIACSALSFLSCIAFCRILSFGPPFVFSMFSGCFLVIGSQVCVVCECVCVIMFPVCGVGNREDPPPEPEDSCW